MSCCRLHFDIFLWAHHSRRFVVMLQFYDRVRSILTRERECSKGIELVFPPFYQVSGRPSTANLIDSLHSAVRRTQIYESPSKLFRSFQLCLCIGHENNKFLKRYWFSLRIHALTRWPFCANLTHLFFSFRSSWQLGFLLFHQSFSLSVLCWRCSRWIQY